MTVTGDQFRDALRTWASGVTVVTAKAGERMHGMTVSAFSSVSADPPLVLVCANRGSKTHEIIQQGGRFAVNILAADQAHVSNTFSSKTLEDERFDHIEWKEGTTDTPLIVGAVANLECEVQSAHQEGSHTIYIGLVKAVHASDQDPLLYFSGAYRSLLEQSE